jgi:molybdopterin-containing oxidoreductase family iron-sulfur binding subunit
MYHQPVACVHCENAPCETVCPVNATIHGPEGINYMTYNRCIGTRYCANNCPYKVRRFNFFDYGVTKFNGDYFFKEVVEKVAPERGGITGSNEHNKINPNLIPPRLRQKLDEISRMQKNPDVTVRSRGVMEKCSYCIQRINAARIETKLDGLDNIPEGFFQVACQQACPSNSITFGDTLDEKSQLFKMKTNARSYALLGYINTRPRTSHMLRLMNPNPNLVSAERKAVWDKPLGHGPGEAPESNIHASLFDSNQHEDGRRTLSLRVLSAMSAIGARA